MGNWLATHFKRVGVGRGPVSPWGGRMFSRMVLGLDTLDSHPEKKKQQMIPCRVPSDSAHAACPAPPVRRARRRQRATAPGSLSHRKESKGRLNLSISSTVKLSESSAPITVFRENRGAVRGTAASRCHGGHCRHPHLSALAAENSGSGRLSVHIAECALSLRGPSSASP